MSSGIFGWWSDVYLDSRWLAVSIRFLHLAALVAGGGVALFFDRQIVATRRATTGRREEVLTGLRGIHPLVITALTIAGFTGVLMTLTDAELFLGSTVYWIKMALVVLLVVNGLWMLQAEKRIGRLGLETGWPRLVVASVVSIVLWLGTLWMGLLLQVAA